MKLSDTLAALLENPEDLSALPDAIAQVRALEQQEQDYQDRIARLQEVNKQYLSMIPIPGDETKPKEPEEPNLMDEVEAFVEAMKGL